MRSGPFPSTDVQSKLGDRTAGHGGTREASLVYRVSRPLGRVETWRTAPYRVFVPFDGYCSFLRKWFRHCTPGTTPEAEEVLVFSGDLHYLVVCVCTHILTCMCAQT